jgi:rod shape-determining protein MreC
MKRLPVFLFFLIIVLIIIFISWKFGFQGLGFFQSLFYPVQKTSVSISHATTGGSLIDQLKAENAKLKVQLSKQQEIQRENQALRDQFNTTVPTSQDLLPATIIGMPAFLPSITTPEELIIDKGTQDGVKVGSVIVCKDSLVGIVTKANNHFSQVLLVTNNKTSFTAKDTATNALGIVKGQGGGQIMLDNVLLSDSLHVGDVVVTGGSVDINGKGYPPGLVVGKITSVEKNPSNLFQKASVQSLVDVAKLTEVFVIVGN